MREQNLRRGFSLIEFMLGMTILLIIVAGLTSTISYFSRSSVRLGATNKSAALAEAIRSDIISQTRGQSWYSMSISTTNQAREDYPGLLYNLTIADIQDNARHVLLTINRSTSDGTLELLKTDDYFVSPRPGASRGARIRLVAKRDTDGSAAEGVFAQTDPLEGTIKVNCINHNNTFGTDSTGECVLQDVHVGPLEVAVQSGGMYFFYPPFATSNSFSVTTLPAQEIVLNVTLKKKSMIIVRTYERNGTSDTNNTIDGVRIYLNGRNLVGERYENWETRQTGTAGAAGESRSWVYPGDWRVTVMGKSDRAGLDFVNSAGSASGYVNVAQDAAPVVQEYRLPSVGNVSGKVVKVNFHNDGTFHLSNSPIANVPIYFSQNDDRVLYTNDWPGGEPTDSTLAPYARYLNNTITNINMWGCSEVYNCGAWPRNSGITASNGTFSIANVGPLFINKDFASPTQPQNARVWARYWPDYKVPGDGTPIMYKAGTPSDRAHSQMALLYNGSWDGYPRNASGVSWGFTTRVMTGGLVDYNKDKLIYLLTYTAANFVHLTVRILTPGGTVFTPSATDSSRFTLKLYDPATTALYNTVAYVVQAAGNQTLAQAPVWQYLGAQPATWTVPYLVPPLGNNAFYLEYQSGSSNNTTTALYNLHVKLISNVATSEGFTNQIDSNPAFTDQPTIRVEATTPLNTGWDTLFTQSLAVAAGLSSFTNTKRINNVSRASAIISDSAKLDPAAGGVTEDITLGVAGPTIPPARVVVTSGNNFKYRPVLNDTGASGNTFGLVYSDGGTPTFSGDLYFVLQAYMRFVGFVYDTGDPNHGVPNPFVKVNVIYKQPYAEADGVISITVPTPTASASGVTACEAPCPTVPQYDVSGWVPMVNNPWHWRIQVTDPSGRFQSVDSPLFFLTTTTPLTQQFDVPLARVAGHGA